MSQPASRVEAVALAASGQPLSFPPLEKIGVIVVDSFPALGKLAALRFIEWVQDNPEGVIALPTGKTPEHFIKEVTRLRRDWRLPEVRRELEAGGVDPTRPCSFAALRFVQIDEFYPISPLQHNSFHHYVNRFYLEGFGLDPERALLIDCSRIGLPEGRTLQEVWGEEAVDLSLRYRQPRGRQEALQKQVLEGVDQWCGLYEDRVRALGGIGFFLGGIGPDGHIAFNVRGSDPHSTTRLSEVNYPTLAAAAADLGGIEVARKRRVITIGLATIAANPEVTAVILAAGEAKAAVVAEAVQSERHIRRPASALHALPGARLYLTRGAARRLVARQAAALRALPARPEGPPPPELQRVVIDTALARGLALERLEAADFRSSPCGEAVLARTGGDPRPLCGAVAEGLRARIEEGTRLFSGRVFLHTEPHHDDLMLGCLPFIVRHIRDHSTRHFFATLTSGFTAVTNAYMARQCRKLQSLAASPGFAALRAQGYFAPGEIGFRNRDVWQYLDGVAAESRAAMDAGEMRRLLRNLLELYGQGDEQALAARLGQLSDYFQSQYPGSKDPPLIQRLKGMCREWEADCLWGYFGWSGEAVRHLRLGFYTGEIFGEEPSVDRDVPPVLALLQEVNPDVVTLALDPEASGPDTHYKVLQILTEALRRHEQLSGRRDLVVLGYRNVWFRFHPCEADLFVPVSLNMFALQHSAFLNTFVSQKEASFPSYAHDGPFSELAQKIQVEQYQELKTCLGRGYFYEHPSALIRATRGMVLLKRMDLAELDRHSRELRRSTEAR